MLQDNDGKTVYIGAKPSNIDAESFDVDAKSPDNGAE
jgi:hypothetical protein